MRIPLTTTGTFQSGYLPLDHFGDSCVGAYSLRNLKTGIGRVVRLIRTGDSAEADFTAEELDNGTATAWIASNSGSQGRVKTLYDQSRNFPNLISNGQFHSDTSGWGAGGGATLAVDNQRLKITNDASGNSYANQTLTTVVGKTYTVSVDYTDDTGGNALIWVGTSFGGNQLGTKTFTATGTYTLNFTATSTTSYLRIGANEATNGTIYFFDNISVKEVGNNANQSSFYSCPLISDTSGNIYKDSNNRPWIDFDGSNDFLDLNISLNLQSISSFCCGKFDAAIGTGTNIMEFMYSLGKSANNSRWWAGNYDGKWHFANADEWNAVVATGADTNQHVFTNIGGSSNAQFYLDGTSKGTDTSVNVSNATPYGIGGATVSDYNLNGKFQELLVFNVDKSTERAEIEAELERFYSTP